jgi:site-specific DNA-methyltransferase (adenine-specific)
MREIEAVLSGEKKWCVVQGDCLEVLASMPDKCTNAVITDPPYKLTGGAGGGAFGRDKRSYHGEIKPLTDGIPDAVLSEMMRVLEKANLHIFCSKDQLRQFINFYEERGCKTDLLTWHKTNPTPTCNNSYLSDTEYLLYFREHGVKLYGNYHSKKKYYVSPCNIDDKATWGHPTIKPLNIISNLVLNASLAGDIIIDPFCGSGTTGVACRDLGRRFIGIELSPEYCDIARNRIANAETHLLHAPH